MENTEIEVDENTVLLDFLELIAEEIIKLYIESQQ